MKKKVVSTLLCTAMVMSLFAGCGSEDTANSSKESQSSTQSSAAEASSDNVEASTEAKSSIWLVGDEEGAELSLALKVGVSDAAPEDMWFFNYYEEMTGVHMDVTAVVSQDWADKKQVMMASGEYPGIIWSGGWTPAEIVEYGADGTFLDLNDYIEYMPNYKKIMDETAGSWETVTCPDGGMYTTAQINTEQFASKNQLWIRSDWLENVGMEKPDTLEEFYQVLKAFKEQDADGDGDSNNEVPWSGYFGVGGNNMRGYLLNGHGFVIDSNTTRNIAFDVLNDGEVVFVPLTEHYKEYLIYMNKMLEEGLVDQDIFSQDETQYRAKTSEGNVGVISEYPLNSDMERYDSYTRVLLGYDDSAEKVAYYPSMVNPGTFVITDNCEDPALAAKWIDLFYAPEHAYHTFYGPMIYDYADGTTEIITEGLSEDPVVGPHVMFDENGKYVNFYWPKESEELGAWGWLGQNMPIEGTYSTTIGEANYLGATLEGFGFGMDDFLKKQTVRYENTENDITNRANGWMFRDDVQVTWDYKHYPYPTTYPSDEQQKWLEENSLILNDYVNQMEVQFITGEKDIETEYDAFIAELKNKGAEEYQKIYQDLYVK